LEVALNTITLTSTQLYILLEMALNQPPLQLYITVNYKI
jgi:hypothetical protein